MASRPGDTQESDSQNLQNKKEKEPRRRFKSESRKWIYLKYKEVDKPSQITKFKAVSEKFWKEFARYVPYKTMERIHNS